MAKLLEEIHPGEILLEDFMKPMGISATIPILVEAIRQNDLESAGTCFNRLADAEAGAYVQLSRIVEVKTLLG